MTGEFEKISEKNLTVKDFSCPAALGGSTGVTLKLR